MADDKERLNRLEKNFGIFQVGMSLIILCICILIMMQTKQIEDMNDKIDEKEGKNYYFSFDEKEDICIEDNSSYSQDEDMECVGVVYKGKFGD